MIPDLKKVVLDLEATGGVVGRNVEHHGAPTPLLPLERHILQEAEVVTPSRRGVHGPGFHLWCIPLGRRRSCRLKCHGLVGRPVGNSTDRFLTL